MEVIKWDTSKPESDGGPAAWGKFLKGYVTAKVFWDNRNSKFYVRFVGDSFDTLPERFDYLGDAKEYAEKQALSILLAATEEESSDHIIFKVIAPGNQIGIAKISTKYNFETVKVQYKCKVDELLYKLTKDMQLGSQD
jgi:hypothetical protein